VVIDSQGPWVGLEMNHWRYPVELVREDNGTVTAVVPDVPRAHTFGDDVQEALARAVDAIESAIIGIMADRESIPLPSKAGRPPTITLPALTVAKMALYETMRAAAVGKAELARRLGWHMPQVDRLLDLRHASRLDQIEGALRALGHELHVEIRPAA
jgi:antitoxin HicB